MEQYLHALCHLTTVQVLGLLPEERHVKGLAIGYVLGEYMFAMAKGFAYLSFYAVAVHSMMESALWHTEEHQHGRLTAW